MENHRLDKKMAAAVNRALAATLLGDVRAGVKVLAKEEVPPQIAARVILEPQYRRASDWRH
jgi:hypothetical protein